MNIKIKSRIPIFFGNQAQVSTIGDLIHVQMPIHENWRVGKVKIRDDGGVDFYESMYLSEKKRGATLWISIKEYSNHKPIFAFASEMGRIANVILSANGKVSAQQLVNIEKL